MLITIKVAKKNMNISASNTGQACPLNQLLFSYTIKYIVKQITYIY